MGEKVIVFKPFWGIFINLIFIITIPLIFLTILSPILKADDTKGLEKLISRIFLVFITIPVISTFIGVLSTNNVKLVDFRYFFAVKELFDYDAVMDENLNILEKTASILTVDDFYKLLSRDNIVAILFGFAIRNRVKK